MLPSIAPVRSQVPYQASARGQLPCEKGGREVEDGEEERQVEEA